MKGQLKSKATTLLNNVLPLLLVLCLFALPSLVFGQNPPDNPDDRPQDVPLDPRMAVILITMGFVLASTVIRKQLGLLQPQSVSAK